ncbi:uncharacterized protein LOC117560259 isoform X2 [Gymnodraco acuticeps]|uniref:Uncharacterized protein LOC117560259 isoform X2 n=1 Tax=Gymnodraco acuticeps TaxID=8218 RepID=A0A6P8WZ96_GYMAC|nr:uncharacterized protein LOC117560259 isoform X2 [Gymnodraco acuticeps]
MRRRCVECYSTHVDMQRYRWPDYEMKLLEELQKQQHNARFCDTLLQTEGISVPTHSCILAALSPYLSEKLSASMSPPRGQKRQLRLQALKGQTLLKLVSLLYSGELEVKGGVEQEDVLSVARTFGITDLVQGLEHLEEKQRNESRTMQDAQVQNEMAERRDQESPSRMGKCVSIGTQTTENIVGGYFTQSTQTEHPTPGPLSSGVQSMDFSLQSQNITLDKHFHSTFCPHIPTMHNQTQSNGESTLDCPSDSEENPTPALSSNVVTFPISLNVDSISTPQEVAAHQQSSKCENTLQVLAKEGTKKDGKTNGKRADDKDNAEQPSHRDEMIRRGKSTLKRLAHVASKSMSKMKQVHHMMETTQIAIKVKLKKNTETGEVWEVVSRRETEETLTLPFTLTQDGSNNKRPQQNLTDGEPPPFSHQPETPILQPIAATPEPHPPPNPTSDSQLLSTECFAPIQNKNVLESASPPKLPGPTEECDEQIGKLLEDIMMDLNILRDVERDSKESNYHQPTQNEPTAICHTQASENEQPTSLMHCAAGCVCYQDFGTQIGHSSSATGIYCSTAQNQPNCSSLSSVQPSSLLIQQQQRFPQYSPPFTAMVRKDGSSMPKTQNCPYPEAVIPTTLYSSGQKTVTALTYYPVCQEPSAQGNPNILEFLPLTNGNEALSSHPLSSMDDLRLPTCLSPLDLPTINNSTHQSSKIQPQTTLDRRPWLRGNPGPLQYPFSALNPKPNKSASVPQYTKGSGWSTQWHLEINPQICETQAASCTVNEVEDRGAISAGPGNVAKPKSDPRIMKESLKKVEKIEAISAGPAHVAEEKSDPRKKRKSVEDIGAISAGLPNVAEQESSSRKKTGGLKCKQVQDVTIDDAEVPKKRKRKHKSSPQEASSLLSLECVKVNNGTKEQTNLSIGSSSNNVLTKEREMADHSNKDLEKPDEPSTIKEDLREGTRGSGDLKTEQRTRITTRGFLKKTQETPSESSIEYSALKPKACIVQIVNKEGEPVKRGRGRPKNKKVVSPPQSSPTAVEKIRQDLNGEPQVDINFAEEVKDETKPRSRKWKRNRSKVAAIPPKKTRSNKNTVKAVVDDNNVVIPAGRKRETTQKPQMVILKEFQKFIKQRHSKTRSSKESQENETNRTSRYVESEGKECGSRTEKLTKIDNAQSQNKDGIKESHVFNVPVDENHNQIFHKSTEECGQSRRDDGNGIGLFGDEPPPVFSFEFLGEDQAKVAAEREHPLKNPDEALKAHDAGVSDTHQTSFNNEDSSHSDTHLPQQNKTPLNPQTPKRTSPPPSDTVGFCKTSGCDQEENEEEEEVEVDILHYSPDKVPPSRECLNGLDNIEMTPEEEEEEEDVNDVDVTGDEAE